MNARFHHILCWIFTSMTFLNCEAVLADINPPIAINSQLTAKSDQAEVVIYYANETAPIGQDEANYEAIIGWLKAMEQHPVALRLAELLEYDAKEFPRIVDQEIAAIREVIAAKSTGRSPIHAIIATNRLYRSGKILKIASPNDQPSDLPVPPLKETNNYILDNNPLLQPEAFATVLRQAAANFPPERHRYILIVKSHGSQDRIVTARIGVQHETISPQLLAADIKTYEESLVSGHSRPGGETSRLVQRVGMTRSDFFGALATAGDKDAMEMPLVFLESCQSGVALTQADVTTTNIGLLFTTDEKGARYRNVDYSQLSNHFADSLQATLYHALVESARSQSPNVNLPAAPRQRHKFPWLALAAIGAVVWLVGGFTWRRWLRNKTNNRSDTAS